MRTCGKQCWWAKSDPKKCECKCLGERHGILREENKELFDRWAEEETKVWRNRQIIRENQDEELRLALKDNELWGRREG